VAIGIRPYGPMSALGHKRTWRWEFAMSASPRKRTFLSTISMSALCRKQTSRLYSIISSARPDKGSGTAIPSARAVFRFMYSSILVAC
jgi:hypothetical protein